MNSRNDIALRATTRWGNDIVAFSPFWLVGVQWEGERCPTCTRELPVGANVAYDEEVDACFCFGCSRRYLDRLERGDPPDTGGASTWNLF